MRRVRAASLAAGAMVAMAGCGSDPLPSAPSPAIMGGVHEDLVLELDVEPARVPPRGVFEVTFQVHNQGAHEIAVTTGHGCLVLPHVYLGEERVPFRGTALGCYTAVTTHTFAPGEIRTYTWEIRAEDYGQVPPYDPTPAPPGTYRLRVEPELHFDQNEWPAVEVPLVVHRAW